MILDSIYYIMDSIHYTKKILGKKGITIMTTRQTGGLYQGYKPKLPASA